MPFVIPLGRYLGIRRGTDVVNPATPVRDPDANYAVVQLATGQVAAPEQFGVLLEAASAAPKLDALLRMLPDLASKHPSGSTAALKQELDYMVQNGLIITLDPRQTGIPDALQNSFQLVPGEPLTLSPDQGDILTEPDSRVSEYQAGGKTFVLNRAFAQVVESLPPGGVRLREVIAQVESADSISNHAQAVGVIALGLQPVLISHAAYLIANPA
jgi:hypothetical protein